VSFVRALLDDAAVVLLDEASSRIDPATEELVRHATVSLLAGRTGVVVAHRPATLDSTDLVLCLDAGRVVEFGPRSELARDPASPLVRLLTVGSEDGRA
jgi:ATP-binding cassette subfamily B protein